MSTEKTEALVIRVADFSESSRVVTFFSRDWGKIATVAKGGRRLKGPFEAALDLLTTCRIVFIRKSSSSLDILTEAQLISRFHPSGRNLTSLYGGYYIAELLAGLTEDYDPHPALFDEAIGALRQFSAGDDARLVVIQFELAILREIGQLPALDACIACGNEFSRGPLAFWVSQSGLLCVDCQKGEYDKQISLSTLQVLRQIAEESVVGTEDFNVTPSQFRQLRQFATSAICHVMGRQPKMLRYLQL